MTSLVMRYLLLFSFLLTGFLGASEARAASFSTQSAPVGLSLSISPSVVDVGYNVTFTLTAKKWPGRSTATVSFISAHHGFTGKMVWNGSCSCFRIAVSVAKRIHSLEAAKAVATVLHQGRSYTAHGTFQIRGLAANGRDYAPGGKSYLSAWVSDPSPNRGETQHYCAWVTTADKLGVPGMTVRFVVHFSSRTQQWTAGKTNRSGLACSRKSIGKPASGSVVKVDAYAGILHATVTFKPR